MTEQSSRSKLELPPAKIFAAAPDWDPEQALKLEAAANPLPRATLGDLGFATHVAGPGEFPLTLLVQPFVTGALAGIDPATVRIFRFDEKARALRPIWNSGINVAFGLIWAKIRQPGIYLPIGLPRDRVVREVILLMARQRAFADSESPHEMEAITGRAVQALLEAPEKQLLELRRFLVMAELQFGGRPIPPEEVDRGGHGGHLLGFVLPGRVTFARFVERLRQLETPPGGLPEEALFLPPERQADPVPFPQQPFLSDGPEPPLPFPRGWPWPWPRPWPPLPRPLPWPLPIPWPWFCRWFWRNWWMYHHDAQHTGHASGCSSITSTTVCTLSLQPPVALPGGGEVVTIPTIVNGKIYVGVRDVPAGGGSLHKIDLATGVVEHTFNVPGRSPAYSQGIGSSPAVAGGKVYFTEVPGRVHCVDAASLAPLWVTDLRNADAAKNQPVQNIAWTDSWTSPVVANGKVYVGCGEGEGGAFGFVYCLDATYGNVIWLFCTNKFTAANNVPNVIPQSAVGISPLPPGFASQPDPPHLGASVWSSCAYDPVLNRIYVGIGNSSTYGAPPGTIDYPYGSGVLALDANTGAFEGFFQPVPADSYYPADSDIDICGSPLLFTRGGTRIVAIGSKSGAFFLLDANTMAPLARRNLLPKDAITNTPLPGVDPGGAGGGENMYGVFGTPAVHYGLGRLFVGLGGYAGIGNYQVTPFLRALNWNTLADAWATSIQVVGANHVAKYTVPVPPMYMTNEAGLSSPAVVNDVVFVTTDKSALYALDAHTGFCLWSAPGLPAGRYVLGPAVYGDYVVVGAGSSIYIYS